MIPIPYSSDEYHPSISLFLLPKIQSAISPTLQHHYLEMMPSKINPPIHISRYSSISQSRIVKSSHSLIPFVIHESALPSTSFKYASPPTESTILDPYVLLIFSIHWYPSPNYIIDSLKSSSKPPILSDVGLIDPFAITPNLFLPVVPTPPFSTSINGFLLSDQQFHPHTVLCSSDSIATVSQSRHSLSPTIPLISQSHCVAHHSISQIHVSIIKSIPESNSTNYHSSSPILSASPTPDELT